MHHVPNGPTIQDHPEGTEIWIQTPIYYGFQNVVFPDGDATEYLEERGPRFITVSKMWFFPTGTLQNTWCIDIVDTVDPSHVVFDKLQNDVVKTGQELCVTTRASDLLVATASNTGRETSSQKKFWGRWVVEKLLPLPGLCLLPKLVGRRGFFSCRDRVR